MSLVPELRSYLNKVFRSERQAVRIKTICSCGNEEEGEEDDDTFFLLLSCPKPISAKARRADKVHMRTIGSLLWMCVYQNKATLNIGPLSTPALSSDIVDSSIIPGS